MSNVDRLSHAGIVDHKALLPDQVKFINDELTAEEIDNLIKIGQKLIAYGPKHHTMVCTWTITV